MSGHTPWRDIIGPNQWDTPPWSTPEWRADRRKRAEQMAERKWVKGPALPKLGKQAQPVPQWALDLIKQADQDREASFSCAYTNETINGEVVSGEVIAKRELAQLRRAAAQLDVGLRAPLVKIDDKHWQLSIEVGARKKVAAKS